jgi:hypothetical protein
VATIPGTMVYSAGSVLTAAEMNTYVSTPTSFFTGGMPLAIMRQTVSQSLANGGLTALTLDTEDVDRDGGHSTTTNTSRYTAQTAGYYDCVAVAAFANNTTNARWIALCINNAAVPGRVSIISPAPGAALTLITISGMVYLNLGDYLENQARQDSGGPLSTFVTSPYQSLLSVRWVSTA